MQQGDRVGRMGESAKWREPIAPDQADIGFGKRRSPQQVLTKTESPSCYDRKAFEE
jgi:hypothetical protein